MIEEAKAAVRRRRQDHRRRQGRGRAGSGARDELRDQVAALAVKGAEQILRSEVNAGVHAELLGRLKTEL